MKKMLASYILILLPFIITAQSFNWQKFESPANSAATPLAVISLNDFWIYEDNGELFHYKNGKWMNHALENGRELSLYKFLQLEENSFIVSAVAADWHSNFYKIVDGKWIKYNFEWEYPAQGFVKNLKGEIFSYGNFGTILKLDDNNWSYIKNPIENHINDAISSVGDSVWFATKTQGVYLYHNNKFRQFTVDDNNHPINKLHLAGNKIYARSHQGKTYLLVNDKFERVSKERSPWERFDNSKRKIGIGYLLSDYDSLESQIVSFPIDYSFAKIKSINSHELIATTQFGEVYFGSKNSTPVFYNLAEAYQIKGNKNQRLISTAIRDLDEDNINDLILIGSSNSQFLYVYKGSENSPYSFITPATGIEMDRFNYLFSIGDITNDVLPEIIFQRKEENKFYISVFENDGGNNFTEQNRIYLEDNFQNFGLRNFTLFDFNEDGFNDILNLYYYGPGDEKGNVEVLKNRFYSSSFESDSSLKQLSRIWNEHVIIGDFDNNDLCDFFLLNRWGTDRILYQYEDGWIDETNRRFVSSRYSESEAGCAFDFDNDADLDIVLIETGKFLTYLENQDGNFFIEKTSEVIPELDFPVANNDSFKRTVCIGDFNNDGYQDLFTSVYDLHVKKNVLLQNQDGKKFVVMTDSYNLQEPYLNVASIGDIDNDGDLDIVGGSIFEKVLYVNQLDNKNFITIKLSGRSSNTEGLFSKIYLYEAGHINDSEYLAGFRQLGSDKFSAHQHNDLNIHFGVKNNKYDLVVKFYGGKTIQKLGLSAGRNYIINEHNAFASFWLKIPSSLYKTITSATFQTYVLVIILAFLFLLYGTKFGNIKYGWDSRLSTIFAVTNISLFWVVLLLASNSDVMIIKYLLPIAILIVGVSIPVIVFFWINKTKVRYRSLENLNEELLSELTNFNHGEWALRNLNSLSLLCKNIPADYITNEKYINQFTERKVTFSEMTSAAIKNIALLAGEIDYDKHKIIELKKLLNDISNKIGFILSKDGEVAAESISLNIIKIIEILKGIRTYIMKEFSCNPESVIKLVTDELTQQLDDHNIIVKRYSSLKENTFVLIKSNELADVMDNLITNSIKMFNDTGNKEIVISLFHFEPKVVIEYKNNGKVIPNDLFEKIFEQGFSESGSSGYGLYYSRKVIQKYNGKFHVSESSEINGTIFRIELNQGVSE
jgi:signal transduction histidine kinase